jgi:hypothetical protein
MSNTFSKAEVITGDARWRRCSRNRSWPWLLEFTGWDGKVVRRRRRGLPRPRGDLPAGNDCRHSREMIRDMMVRPVEGPAWWRWGRPARPLTAELRQDLRRSFYVDSDFGCRQFSADL